MKSTRYRRDRIGNHILKPETMMLGYGYDPALSEGAVKPPVFLTSTFVFRSAEEGRDFFNLAAGRSEPEYGVDPGLVYSRFNHPNSEIVEDRLAIYEGAEVGAIFSSGMAAITTTLLAYCRPGDAILHSQPLYGGTETLIARTLQPFGIAAIGFADGIDEAAIRAAAEEAMKKGRVSVVLQKPLQHGTDIVVYSLTKYVGGHSDLIAGAALGSQQHMRSVKLLRGAIGTQLDPHSAWMIARSLETLSLRMTAACRNAEIVAQFLAEHPRVAKVYFSALLPKDDPARRVFEQQCGAAGATFSFDVKGGEREAFQFLNALEIFKLAVSLGGTESLLCHPATTVHSGVPKATRERIGISDATIRLSIGIENADDLVADLTQALAAIGG